MRKILIVGHACSPGLGSEPGVTWGWAWHLSQTNQVWVIAHPEYRDRVEGFLASRPTPNLNFIWVTVDNPFDRWTPGREQEKGIRLHYWLWLKEAYKRASLLHKEIHFDLAHHVSWTTISLAPPFWRLSVPTVWGPLGGGQVLPSGFSACFSGRKRLTEGLRSLYLNLVPFFIRRSVSSTSLVLAVNYETKARLKSAGAGRVELFLDCGMDPRAATMPVTNPHEGHLTLLWAGRMEPQKGLSVAIRALAACKDHRPRLLVAGTGSEHVEMEKLAGSLGLKGRIEFLGRVPSAEMPSLFRRCDVFFFTALRDSSGSVVWEAMSHGLPVVTLNHQGMEAFVSDNAAIKVLVRNQEQVIKDLALAIEELASKPESLYRMSAAAFALASEHTWSRRAEKMNGFYTEVLNNA